MDNDWFLPQHSLDINPEIRRRHAPHQAAESEPGSPDFPLDDRHPVWPVSLWLRGHSVLAVHAYKINVGLLHHGKELLGPLDSHKLLEIRSRYGYPQH